MHGAGGNTARAVPRLFVLVAILYVLPRQTSAQLDYLQQNSAVNPFQGQATAPEGFNKSVDVYVILTRLLQVDDNSYSFKVNFWWAMMWDDDRAADQIISNTVSDPDYICQAWCSTEQGLDSTSRQEDILNSTDGLQHGLCCDGVYVPGAVAQNVISYDVSSLPVQYQLSVLPNNRLSYRVQVQGDFYTNYNFKSYPFDRHQLTVNVQTQFLPSLANVGTGSAANFYVVYAKDFGQTLDENGAEKPQSVDVYNSAQLSQGQAWQIDRLELQPIYDVYGLTRTKNDPPLEQVERYKTNSNGVRFIIHISRTSKGFYALMIIVPVSLIVLFSFVIFVLPVTQIKGRLNIMATLFLTLIVLQFVLESILPSAYTLIPPYYLLLVSYVYIFVMVGLAVFTNALAMQWQRRSARVGRKEAKMKFWKWIDELPPPPPGSKLKFGQLPDHHHLHNPITEGRHALARMLTRRFNSSKKTPAQREVVVSRPSLAAPSASFRAPALDCDTIPEDEKPFDGADEGSDSDHTAVEVPNGDAAPQPQPRLTALQTARLKSRPWTMKERSSLSAFLLRSERVRWWSMWYYFIGRPESKEYCEFCAIKVERWCLPFLLISYTAVVAIIFGVAQASSGSNRNTPVG